MYSYSFTCPEKTIIGNGALLQAEDILHQYGSKALIVTGKIVTSTGIVGKLTDILDKVHIEYVIFNEITNEPTDIMIDEGVSVYKANDCNFIIGIGGGSPLDSAKAIGAMTILEGKLSDYMGKQITGRIPPLVLIPTTAGTGSETTKMTVITDTAKDVKMLLMGESLLPKLAILDPSLTKTAPKSITAATGMDALTHAIEAYTSRKATPVTDMYAIEAIKKIFKYLPIAYNNGEDDIAREEMVMAAYYAGICINNASVTLVHGMSRPIGALFHVPHGISNAMLLSKCLTYVLDDAYEKFGKIGRIIGEATDDDSDKRAAELFIEELKKLCRIINIPTLEEYGIKKEEFEKAIDKMAADAMISGSPSNTIKNIDKNDLINIYKQMYN